MAGETEGLFNTMERIEALTAQLKRTIDLGERRLIADRLKAARDERDAAFEEVVAAADRGDREAKKLIDILETEAAKIDD